MSHHPDPRVHGPNLCPRSCGFCHGRHHWVEDGFEPDIDPPGDDEETRTRVVAFDYLHGTEHALAFYACKHCSAWAEEDYIGECEEDDPDDDYFETFEVT